MLVGMDQFIVDDGRDLLQMKVPEELFDLVGQDSGSPSSGDSRK